MSRVGSRRRMGALAGLVARGLAASAAGQTRDDFANACAPLITLLSMSPPPGEQGNVVRRLQAIAAGIAQENVDLIVSAYAEGARVENFPRLLSADDRNHLMTKDQLRRTYRAYFENFPGAAVVFTHVTVSVKGSHALASARARFVLPPGQGRDTFNATVTWTLAKQKDGWTITEERYREGGW